MPDLSNIGGLIKLPLKYWVALALASGFVLWDPFAVETPFIRTSWLPVFRLVAWCVCAVATSLTLVALAEWEFGMWQERKRQQDRCRRLHDLTLEEKMLLFPSIQSGSRTLYLRVNDSVVEVLERDGILTTMNTPGGGRDGYWSYRMEESARKYLNAHPDLVNPLALSPIPSLPDGQNGTAPAP